MEGVGKRIAEHRENLGLSINDLAIQLRMHPDYLRQIEDGRWQNPRDILPKIASVLKTTIPDLIDYPETRDLEQRLLRGADAPNRILFFRSRGDKETFCRLMKEHHISHRSMGSHDVLVCREDLERVSSWQLYAQHQPYIRPAL